MKTDREKPAYNLGLPLRDMSEGLGLPMHLDGISGGVEIHQVLEKENQRLWQEKPGGKRNVLVVDTRSEEPLYAEMDPAGMSFIRASQEKFDMDKKPSAIVHVISPLDPEDDEVRVMLDMHTDTLMRRGVLYIFEERKEGMKPQTDWRKEKLSGSLLVKKDVLTGLSDDFVVWRGRMEKPRKKTEINFLDFSGKNFWRERYVREKIRRVSEEYGEHGFRILSRSEVQGLEEVDYSRNPILERLMASTNIPDDLSKLDNGFGFILEAQTCKCVLEVGLDGTQQMLKKCHSGTCQLE